MFPVDCNRRPSLDLQLPYDFLWFSIGFPRVLLCFWLLVIVSPRPIFGYLMISYGFILFSYGFAMFLVDFHRRPSHDLMFFYGFALVFIWFCYVSG